VLLCRCAGMGSHGQCAEFVRFRTRTVTSELQSSRALGRSMSPNSASTFWLFIQRPCHSSAGLSLYGRLFRLAAQHFDERVGIGDGLCSLRGIRWRRYIVRHWREGVSQHQRRIESLVGQLDEPFRCSARAGAENQERILGPNHHAGQTRSLEA
jgi:hypothetical protein